MTAAIQPSVPAVSALLVPVLPSDPDVRIQHPKSIWHRWGAKTIAPAFPLQIGSPVTGPIPGAHCGANGQVP